MDFELIFWVVAGIAGLISIGVLWALVKKNSMNYVEWVEEYDQ